MPRRLPLVEDIHPNRSRHGRSRTIHPWRFTRRERDRLRELYPDDPNVTRPAVRGDCVDGPRPCPFVGCRWHLYLEVLERSGAIRLNFPDLEVDELTDSCALDIADRGGVTLDVVAKVLRVSRERIRQLEERAKSNLERVEGFPDFLKAVLSS